MRPFLIAVALTGCTLPTETLDPTSVVTGIYTFTASSQSDTCEPQRFIGSTNLAIYTNADGIVMANFGTGTTRRTLPAASDYTTHVPAAGTTIQPCPGGGSFALDFTLTAASASAFDVSETETWNIVTPCSNAIIDADSVPLASCAASRTLHYALFQACATPCVIIDNGVDALSCSCPQGSGGTP
jgi:hypothetical protein